MEWAILPAPAGAAPLLAALHAACFADSWSEASFAALLMTPGTFALLAMEAKERPVGFIACRAAAEECEVLSFGVLEEARRQGAGQALLFAAEAAAREMGARAMFLEVAADNFAARALYKRFSYAEIGRRRDYYTLKDRSKVDALVLRHNLGDEPGSSPDPALRPGA